MAVYKTSYNKPPLCYIYLRRITGDGCHTVISGLCNTNILTAITRPSVPSWSEIIFIIKLIYDETICKKDLLFIELKYNPRP